MTARESIEVQPAAAGFQVARAPASFQTKIQVSAFPFAGLLLCGLGLLLSVEVDLLGTLFAGEAVLAVIALFAIARNLANPRFWTRTLTLFVSLFCISLLAYVVTDLVRATLFHNAFRGWARAVFTLLDAIGLYAISRRNRFNLFPIVIGLALGEAVELGNADFLVQWKYHVSLPFAAALLCLVAMWCRKRLGLYSVLVLLAVGGLDFALDSRSAGGVCFSCAAILAAVQIKAVRWRRLVPLLRGVSVAAALCAMLLLLTETSDRYGKRRDLSFALRAASMITGIKTIAANPIIGAGSWTNSYEAERIHRAVLTDFGFSYDTEPGNQSGHSTIVQAWVEAGFFGAAIFFFYLWRLIAAFGIVLKTQMDAFTAFAAYEILFAAWHCLFSPFLGWMRVEIALSMAICLAVGDARLRRPQKIFLLRTTAPPVPSR